MKSDVELYVDGFDGIAKERLQHLRALVKELLHDVEEKMGYGVLAYHKKGAIVYLAAFKNHTGMYPVPLGDEVFRKELSHYQTGKGTVRFPHDQPLPLAFIKQFVTFLAQENEQRRELKK